MRDGFTFFEIIVTISILAIITGSFLYLSPSLYRGETIIFERDALISIFEKSRAKAISNVRERNHGVYMGLTNNFIIFEGISYATRDEEFDEIFAIDNSVTISGANEIVFSSLDGSVIASGTILLTRGNQLLSVSVNEEGAILW